MARALGQLGKNSQASQNYDTDNKNNFSHKILPDLHFMTLTNFLPGKKNDRQNKVSNQSPTLLSSPIPPFCNQH